jgi:hypothetical protein
MMGEFDENQNPYAVLGLEKGHESTDAEIKKVSLCARGARFQGLPRW